MATEYCTDTVQKSALNCEREDYGPKIVAEDDAYTIAGMERAVGLRPTIAEDGTEVYPEVIGCPVHQHAPLIPELPENWDEWLDWPEAWGDPSDWEDIITDPNDPNYDPSFGGVIPVPEDEEPAE
jgi:hypothetical protein